MSKTRRVRARFQPSLLVRVLCAVPLVLLVVVLAWGGVSTGGLVGWLSWLGAVFVAAVIGRAWVIRVDDLGDSIRVVNWTRSVDVPWSQVERFEFDGGVSVRRTDLTNVPLSAFPALSRDFFGFAERRNRAAYEALEATRKRRRHQARHAGPT